jgi:hypothetical protein
MTEEEYIGGKLHLGEIAILDAYTRILDNVDRVRATLTQESPLYLIEKTGYILAASAELAHLLDYWRDAKGDQAIRWELLERAMQCRALWGMNARRIIRVLHPLPKEVEYELRETI